MFVVAEFPDEKNGCMVIRFDWVRASFTSCNYPPGGSEEVEKALNEGTPPQPNWKKKRVNLKYKCASKQEAEQKLTEYLDKNLSALETDEDELGPRSCRGQLPHRLRDSNIIVKTTASKKKKDSTTEKMADQPAPTANFNAPSSSNAAYQAPLLISNDEAIRLEEERNKVIMTPPSYRKQPVDSAGTDNDSNSSTHITSPPVSDHTPVTGNKKHARKRPNRTPPSSPSSPMGYGSSDGEDSDSEFRGGKKTKRDRGHQATSKPAMTEFEVALVNSMTKFKSKISRQLETVMGNMAPAAAPLLPAPKGFPVLPIDTLEEFKAFNSKVKNEEAIQSHLISLLTRKRGENEKESVKLILNCLMTTSLMTEFNWKGLRGKKGLTVEVPTIVKLIRDAVVGFFAPTVPRINQAQSNQQAQPNQIKTEKQVMDATVDAAQKILKQSVIRLKREKLRLDASNQEEVNEESD